MKQLHISNCLQILANKMQHLALTFEILLIVFDSFCMVESEEETETQNKTRLRN